MLHERLKMLRKALNIGSQQKIRKRSWDIVFERLKL